MMELNTANINKLIEWQQGGDRSIKIEIDSGKRLVFFTDKPLKIWVYDYTYETGDFIEKISDLPTEKSMEQDLIKRKKKEIQDLDDRINGLKVVA